MEGEGPAPGWGVSPAPEAPHRSRDGMVAAGRGGGVAALARDPSQALPAPVGASTSDQKNQKKYIFLTLALQKILQ